MNFNQNKKKWIVLYTKHRYEKLIEKELSKNGVEVYLPILKERRKWSDRKKWIERPLFRSYIFVKIELKDILFVVQTIGIIKVIKFSSEIAIVRDSSIKAIKLMLEGGYRLDPTDYFIKGDPVEVKEGPLKGIIGEVIRIDQKDKLLVRVSAIKHSIAVQINRGYLKLIKNPQT